MQNKKQLKEIAEIVVGYTFRSALQEQKNGEISVIQAKNVINNAYVDDKKLSKIARRDYHTSARVKKNDIFITSRGVFRAGFIDKEISDSIASSSMYILRLKDDKIKPEYLMIYLNSNIGQKAIQEKATGGAIKTILKKDLENIVVRMDDIETQNQIISLYKNNKRQQEMLSKKKDLVNNIIQNVINNLITA
ncbi:hypothetical protein ACFL23_01360 [Patescibacteria group bacterium]